MIATSRFTAVTACAALALSLAACTVPGYEPSPSATRTATPSAPVAPEPAPEPLAGTTLVDPASATRVTEGDGANSELVATFDDGAIDVAVALADDGSLLFIRIPEGHIDQDVIVKPAEYAWFDGDFTPLGSTADLVAGDAFRQSFAEWTDGETTVWVESPSIQAGPYPWRIFAAGRDGGPTLIATSEDAGAESDYPVTPEPVIFGGHVYWAADAPAGEVLGDATWSAPLAGGPAQMQLLGARNPAATDAGVFATTTIWGPEGAAALEPGAYRVVRVDDPAVDQTLRTLDVGVDGGVGVLMGEGRWLATTFDARGVGDGIVVFSAASGDGYSIAPLRREMPPRAVIVRLCDAALVWAEPGEDWMTDTFFRLDLDTGELLAVDAPSLFRISDCNGDDVLWSQADDNGAVNQYVTTVG